ncbi:MAG: Trehalose synthase [Candidatus Methanoperedenaceae archaeon GB50]|nr:MAG: Trehalose synthase [Candidatus Methanoperedenaceae archaeon GB50]
MGKLEFYADIVGYDVIDHLYQLSSLLKNIKVIHVNSTRKGGGVAEILEKLVPLSQELGIDTKWEVITGNERFFHCTKSMHNALQGNPLDIPNGLLKVYEETNAQNAEKLCPALEEADVVFIHDPQPAPLLKFCPKRKGKWVWRCHIDISRPYRPVWKYLRDFIKDYDASIFHLADFAQPLPHPLYLIPPSIDPLSEKNKELEEEKVHSIYEKFNINPELPTIVQVSRFDRFKDPLGVIRAYRLAKEFIPSLQLILAGGGAADDPETEIVLAEVKEVASGDPNIHILIFASRV